MFLVLDFRSEIRTSLINHGRSGLIICNNTRLKCLKILSRYSCQKLYMQLSKHLVSYRYNRYMYTINLCTSIGTTNDCNRKPEVYISKLSKNIHMTCCHPQTYEIVFLINCKRSIRISLLNIRGSLSSAPPPNT